MPVTRRNFVKKIALLSFISSGWPMFATKNVAQCVKGISCVRPGSSLWPTVEKWNTLKVSVNGNLIKIESPWNICMNAEDSAACQEIFRNLKNPYFIRDHPALTQTSGYHRAWRSQPSIYAVVATCTADVVAAVNFARIDNLRLVVKGGGHSYQGTSNAPDSLLVWTKRLNKIQLNSDFVALGCEKIQAPQHAVTLESGAVWMEAYNAVTTNG
jgi:hypothetical protein